MARPNLVRLCATVAGETIDPVQSIEFPTDDTHFRIFNGYHWYDIPYSQVTDLKLSFVTILQASPDN